MIFFDNDLMKILDRLPLLPTSQAIRFGAREIRLHRDALVVWLSVGLRGETNPTLISRPFPALLDSGNHSAAYLNEHHLVNWGGIQPAFLGLLQYKFVNEISTPFHNGDAWIHPNLPGTHERDPEKMPVRLKLDDGIAVSPVPVNQNITPRVPLLGFRALRENGLDFWLDSQTEKFTVWKSDWRSRLFRTLCRLF